MSMCFEASKRRCWPWGAPESAPGMARGGAWNRMFPRAEKEYPMASAGAGDIR